MPKSRSQDISDIFTKEGIQKLKKGQILRFNYEGSINELRITYINKKTGTVRAIETKTYHQSEIRVKDKKDV